MLQIGRDVRVRGMSAAVLALVAAMLVVAGPAGAIVGGTAVPITDVPYQAALVADPYSAAGGAVLRRDDPRADPRGNRRALRPRSEGSTGRRLHVAAIAVDPVYSSAGALRV